MEILKVKETLPAQDREKLRRSLGITSLRYGEKVDSRVAKLPSGMLGHGTPIAPYPMGEYIKPRQAVSYTSDGRTSVGPRVISVSAENLRFPVYRSFFHHLHPYYVGTPICLLGSRVVNRLGESYQLVAGEAVRRITPFTSGGAVYIACNPPESAFPFTERADYDEWRVPEPMQWDVTLHTRPEDLLDDWPLVIDEPKEVQDKFIDACKTSNLDPIELGSRLGVPIMPLGEYRQMYAAELIRPTLAQLCESSSS